MVNDRTLVAIPCLLSPGMFSSERVFEVQMANGDLYRGVSPRHFCWTESGKLVGDRDAVKETRGFLAARRVDEPAEDQVAVEVPDGEVLAVWKQDVRPRPTPIVPPSGYPARN